MATIRITNIVFQHYKALKQFSLGLEHMNLLTGANNAGKSTIIGALRALSIALRSARSRSPERIHVGDERLFGYRISEKVLPLSLENIATDYQEGASKVSFRLSNGNKLILHFDQEGCILVPDVLEKLITSAATFKSNFPIELIVVPVLGPVEHHEQLLEEDTVNAALATPRASRHFRNYWYRRNDDFAAFAKLVASTWSGMVISAPERVSMSRDLTMFVSEDRIARELFWVGYGFQIWCQLLTHLSRAATSSLVVIDEPEIYLHPDVQRRLLGVLKDLGPDVLLATHSTEIIAEADPGDLVLIDKRRASGERLKDIDGVQRAMRVLGSQQNITLTALARNRRVLFVEGDHDFAILRRFAKRIGLDELASGAGLAAMPSGGFGSWKRISVLAEGVAQALGTELLIGAVYDRDFFCEEEIQEVLAKLCESLRLAHVHTNKELENYLLVPAALDRAIQKAIAERSEKGHSITAPLRPTEKLLIELTDDLKEDTEAQCIDKYSQFFKSSSKSGIDGSTLTKEALRRFRTQWDLPMGRLKIVSGKETLRRLREKVSEEYGITLSDARIIDSIRPEEIPVDLRELLSKLNDFRRLTVPGSGS